MAEPGTFIGEVQRGVQRFWGLSWWWKGPILAVVVLLAVGMIAAVAGGGDDDSPDQIRASESTRTSRPLPDDEDDPTPTDEPSKTDAPTDPHTPEPTRAPTPEPTPEPTATPEPTPVVIQGFGLTATETVSPPSSISVVTLTHNGSANFIVWSHQDGSEDLMVNVIGSYSGKRPLFGESPVLFDVDADGAWTITLAPISTATTAEFSGSGDDVSGLFSPPSTGGWNVSHTGTSNFVVWLHCAGGSDLVANEIGAVGGSTVVDFEEGPCLWEVEADGSWSVTPQ